MMNNTITHNTAKTYLKELYEWSLNGLTCWADFVTISHNEDGMESIDFTKYGYTELVLFGRCLTIFNNWGLEEVNKMIEEVIKESQEEE